MFDAEVISGPPAQEVGPHRQATRRIGVLAPATARRVRLFLRLVLAGTAIGIVYGGLTGFLFNGTVLPASLQGAIDDATITTVIAAVEIFLLPTPRSRALRPAPFLLSAGAKWLAYGGVITAVNASDVGGRVLGVTVRTSPVQGRLDLAAVLFSLAAAFAVLFVLDLSRIVGARTLRTIALGRSRQPRVEERFFLFVDVADSTSLAERLGPAAVHRFLDRVFRLASDPIADHGGEIYQYVGDEMVVTWMASAVRGEARPLACFFAMAAALEEAAPEFVRDFGAVPRLRAALHAGTVIRGEIGDTKRDVAFHGDVMNTAARLEQATRDLDRRFLASADALGRLAAIERYALEPLGLRALRGRAAPVEVYAVASTR